MNLTPSNATDAPVASLAPDAPENTAPLDHERLDVFRVALDFAAMVPALTKAARPALRDQIERASSSIALLVAEGNTPFPQVGWAQALDARAVIATTSSRWPRAPRWSALPPSTFSA